MSPRASSEDETSATCVPKGLGPRIYVGGVPNALSQTMIKNHFSHYGKASSQSPSASLGCLLNVMPGFLGIVLAYNTAKQMYAWYKIASAQGKTQSQRLKCLSQSFGMPMQVVDVYFPKHPITSQRQAFCFVTFSTHKVTCRACLTLAGMTPCCRLRLVSSQQHGMTHMIALAAKFASSSILQCHVVLLKSLELMQ